MDEDPRLGHRGQRKALARLGVPFDKVIFESDFLPEVAALADPGLREGTLRRRADGMVVDPTEREERRRRSSMT